MKQRLAGLFVTIVCVVGWPVSVDAAPAADAPVAKFDGIAVVNGKAVGREEYERALSVAVRNRFYHRAPPDGEIEGVRREVAESLVNRALILAVAEAREISVDEATIKQTIEGFEIRYGASPAWPQIRETRLPALKRELIEQQMLAKLEANIRDIPAPADEDVRGFYATNPALFTEPERAHVSVILLKVDPAATKLVRDSAREEGRKLRERIGTGADFAELAKLHSGDASAAKGGDLGYLHRGMLAESVHAQIDALTADEVSMSFDVLEGVAIIKLHKRTQPELRSFDAVSTRALELLKREQSDKAWKNFVAGLRSAAVVEMDPSWLASSKPRGD